MNRRRVVIASTAMVTFIAAWEGTKPDPYRDITGTWTVCTGNTADVVPGKTYTAEECSALLSKDIEQHGRGVLQCVAVPLGANEMTALVSFAFNVGTGAFCGSTLVRKLNAGDRQGAADEFLRWTHSKGRFVQGLLNRRKAERDLFLTPDPKAIG